MKVLLVVPTHRYAFSYPEFLSLSDFPVGLAYLAASLKQAEHEVVGVNPNNIVGYVSAPVMLADVVTRAIKKEMPGLVGLGGLATDFPFLKDAIGVIRTVSPETPIVLGGQIVTNDAEDIFNILKPDYAIVGEGEEALVRLAGTIESGANDFESIDNLWYWKEE